MLQAVVGAVGTRYEVVDSHLTAVIDPREAGHPSRRATRANRRAGGSDAG
jgi:hypothetical protein